MLRKLLPAAEEGAGHALGLHQDTCREFGSWRLSLPWPGLFPTIFSTMTSSGFSVSQAMLQTGVSQIQASCVVDASNFRSGWGNVQNSKFFQLERAPAWPRKELLFLSNTT